MLVQIIWRMMLVSGSREHKTGPQNRKKMTRGMGSHTHYQNVIHCSIHRYFFQVILRTMMLASGTGNNQSKFNKRQKQLQHKNMDQNTRPALFGHHMSPFAWPANLMFFLLPGLVQRTRKPDEVDLPLRYNQYVQCLCDSNRKSSV